MGRPKRRVELTDDNVYDHFPADALDGLTAGLTVGEGGTDRDGPEVTAFLAWLAAQNAQAVSAEYHCTQHDAAVILELAAGWLPPVG